MVAQWGWHLDQETPPAMPLGHRIRQLRKDNGWSQADLATKIGVDPGRISRYEAGRITPSAEALVRLAQTLDISLDHLLIDGTPRRTLHTPDNPLGPRLTALTELTPDDLNVLTSIIDALLAKTRLRHLTNTIGN